MRDAPLNVGMMIEIVGASMLISPLGHAPVAAYSYTFLTARLSLPHKSGAG